MTLLPQILSLLPDLIRAACEILILASLIYMALLFVRGTRAAMTLAGLTTVILGMSLLTRLAHMDVIEWILMKALAFLALAVLIIFQPEIRRAFAEIGSQQSRLRALNQAKREKEVINTLLEATFFLASHRIGALFAIEQSIGTRAYAETGTEINAPISKELLATIFFPNTPLHDGGVILHDGLVVAAGCIFPLTQSSELSKSLGTRHRAGVGLTEETDAIAVIVSEESGAVSMAYKGRLIRGITRERLERHLTFYLVKRPLARRKRGALADGIGDFQAELEGGHPPDDGSGSS